MEGRTLDIGGNTIARWTSEASGIQINERRVFYLWTGRFPSTPEESWEGYGEIIFSDTADMFMDGNGLFIDITVTDLKAITNQSSEFYRCIEEEIKTMLSKDKLQISKLVSGKIQELSF